ncbi:MAG: LysM peptidoglycan-binding domain-containing protein [Pseudobutyrivibrio sp.]|nr:LysM peptidoglycan-binding domain-containing protein [Pseudobutyrivibrio sp.]
MNRRVSKAELIVRRRKLILFLVIITILFAFILSFKSQVTASNSREEFKYYTSIQIQSGDSLWSIADTYISTDHNNREEYIREVRQINHIGEYEDIHAGEYLVIPYYSYEVL